MVARKSNSPILLDIKWEMAGKKEAFETVFGDREIIMLADAQAQNRSLDDIAYAVVWQPEDGLLASLPSLEVIFSLGAGVDHAVRDPRLPDLPLVRFVDEDLTGRMVEWVVLQVLMHVRQQRSYDRFQRDRNWKELPQPAAHHFRVGIMGLGTLGKACAQALSVLGFQLNGWSRSAKQMDGVTVYAGEDGLEPFLVNTDILVSLLPLTDATRGMLNRSLIEKLACTGPFGAPVLINAGRGGSQVEVDIVEALADGTLFGASLDVFENEPLVPESPLWGFENAVITPHMAAVSDPSALAQHVAKQIKRFESGQPLEHLVDRSLGY